MHLMHTSNSSRPAAGCNGVKPRCPERFRGYTRIYLTQRRKGAEKETADER